MLLNNIFDSISGLNEDKSPKCAFAVSKERYEIGNAKPIEVSERISFKPEIKLAKLPGYSNVFIMVDIIYESMFNIDFQTILQYLNEYRDDISTINDESTEITQISFTFVPLEYKGKYYIVANSPIFWCLTYLDKDKEKEALRMLFPADCFTVYETSSVDYERIASYVDTNIQEEAEFEAKKIIEAEQRKAAKADLHNSVLDATNALAPNPAELVKQHNTENGEQLNIEDYLDD